MASRAFAQPTTLPAAPADAPRAPRAGFFAVAPSAAVPLGLSAAPSFAGGPLVLARTAARLAALSANCPHKGAELALGDIEDADGRLSVKCPRHRQKFPGGLNLDCETGAAWCAGTPQAGAWDAAWGCGGDAAVFDVFEEAGWVFVSATPRVPQRKAPADAGPDSK